MDGKGRYKRQRSRSRSRSSRSRSRSRKRSRKKSRSRSRSSSRSRSRNRRRRERGRSRERNENQNEHRSRSGSQVRGEGHRRDSIRSRSKDRSRRSRFSTPSPSKSCRISSLEIGDICEGIVRRVLPYGAFIELIGLVDNTAHGGPESKTSDKTQTKGLFYFDNLGVNSVKTIPISLSDPADSRTGLLHVSRMKYDERVEVASDVASVGMTFYVKILDIERVRHHGHNRISKLSLSLRSVDQRTGMEIGRVDDHKNGNQRRDNFDYSLGRTASTNLSADMARRSGYEEGDSPEPPALGSIHRGIVCKVMNFGCFVKLPGYRTQGLVHISQLNAYRTEKVEEVCDEGDQVWVKVIDITHDDTGQTRIALSRKYVSQTDGEDLDETGLQYSQEQSMIKQRNDMRAHDEAKRKNLQAFKSIICHRCGGAGHVMSACPSLGEVAQSIEYEWGTGKILNGPDADTGAEINGKLLTQSDANSSESESNTSSSSFSSSDSNSDMDDTQSKVKKKKKNKKKNKNKKTQDRSRSPSPTLEVLEQEQADFFREALEMRKKRREKKRKKKQKKLKKKRSKKKKKKSK